MQRRQIKLISLRFQTDVVSNANAIASLEASKSTDFPRGSIEFQTIGIGKVDQRPRSWAYTSSSGCSQNPFRWKVGGAVALILTVPGRSRDQ